MLTLFGPPDRISAAGRRAATSVGGDAVRHDLREDLQLPHAAGDQLGVLGAEVDDEDGAAGSVAEALVTSLIVRRW